MAHFFRRSQILQSKVLRTLDPKKLETKDILDISNYDRPVLAAAKAKLGPHSTTLSYPTQSQDVFVRARISYGSPGDGFPPGTRGVLYMHNLSLYSYVAGMSVRFRVLDSLDEKDAFSRGTDLKNKDGSVWKIPLDRVLRIQSYWALRDVLIRDGLVSLRVVARYHRPTHEPKPQTTMLPTLAEPFLVDFACEKVSLVVEDGEKEFSMIMRAPFDVDRLPSQYTGQGILKFELKEATKTQTRRLVLRVVEVVTPPNPNDEFRQIEGTLLKKTFKGGMFERVWSRRNLAAIPPCLLAQLK
ncbi:hypothetical protein FA15DRAFT_666978 [Coprinopsis marcescibilis]|uniref:Uncharacterized protein n=1 Tax=Coprinopsis marcescibilis TaxID=230819 RepID=A0A5C3L1K4_COPMA|nr:hypothetical protein FA15DRAFT_666978 [Coprinopsis marcescibilis]